jgi:hypothetical protein
MILVVQWCGDAKVAKEYGAIIVNEEICCFDIPVNKSVDMQIAVDGRTVEEWVEVKEMNKLA